MKLLLVPALMLAGAVMVSTAQAAPTAATSHMVKIAKSQSDVGVGQVNWRHHRHHRHHRHRRHHHHRHHSR